MRANNKKISTKRGENTKKEVKNIFERAKLSLIHKQNEKEDDIAGGKDIKYGTAHSIRNPLIKQKLSITVNDDYSFDSKIIDEHKTSIENLNALTSQLNTIFSKYSEKNQKKCNLIKKGIKLEQSTLSTMSSSS